jgi:crotonobetainyl-CoA:carnitine CoA-transferase CaiB-like acyl-CoA transferase
MHFQPRLVELLTSVPGCEALATDERFTTRELRTQHRSEYESLAQRAFATRPSAEWLDALQTIGIPASPVQRIDDAMTHAQMAYRGGFSEIEVPGLGTRTVLAPPFRFDGARKTETTPPPTLGEHTLAVLRGELGYDDAAIAALRERGAFGDWPQDP